MPHFLQIWVADASAYNLELSIFGAAICPMKCIGIACLRRSIRQLLFEELVL